MCLPLRVCLSTSPWCPTPQLESPAPPHLNAPTLCQVSRSPTFLPCSHVVATAYAAAAPSPRRSPRCSRLHVASPASVHSSTQCWDQVKQYIPFLLSICYLESIAGDQPAACQLSLPCMGVFILKACTADGAACTNISIGRNESDWAASPLTMFDDPTLKANGTQ